MRFWRRPRRGFASITQPICPTFSLLGQASVPLGRADDAIRFYELALDLDLTDVSTRLNLANQPILKGRGTMSPRRGPMASTPMASGRPIA